MFTTYHSTYRWEPTTSCKHHAHASDAEKMPTKLTDFHPNVSWAMKQMAASTEKHEESKTTLPSKQHHAAEPGEHKKVHFVEHEEVIVEEKDGKVQVYEETIDMEADGFIQKRHKDFSKSTTFKV